MGDRTVHVDWKMTEDEWGQLRSVLLHSNLPYPRRLAAEGKLGKVTPHFRVPEGVVARLIMDEPLPPAPHEAEPKSGYYVTSRIETTDGAAYRISYCGEPQGTMCVHQDGSRHYFGADGEKIRDQLDWPPAIDEWHAWNPGIQRYDRSDVR